MRSLALVLAFGLMLSPLHARGAYQVVSLASVAARNGYTLAWLGPERSVSLSRPGMVIVLRPGAVLYDVNAHVEVADVPPIATRSGDLLISSWLAGRLRALAQGPSRSGSPSTRTAQATGGAIRGSIVLQAQQLEDSQALAIAGQAPPNAPITITLLATLAPDLPTVILSRHDVQSDVLGRFEAIVPVASDYLPGTLVTVVATSLPEVTPASAFLRLATPNAKVSAPFEREPRRAQ